MKKGAIISLITAGVLLLVGSILWVLGFSCLGGWEDVPAQAEKTYIVNDSFTRIQVDATSCDVAFVKTDGAFRAVCPDSEKLSYTVTVEEGTLCVRQVDLRRWYDFIGITLGKQEITLYLPDSQYDALQIESATGDVFVPEDFSFTVAEVRTSTGDVEFAAAVADRLTASTSTGYLVFRGSEPAMVQVSTSTGDVTLQDMACGDCFVKTTTGNIHLANLTCQTLDCQSDTGDHHLQGVLAKTSINMITTTGDVTILGCDAESVDIQTDTGDIAGSFLTSKWFQASSGTGDVTVPQTREGGVCRIESNTGDISFY